jgi:hypothetical protein
MECNGMSRDEGHNDENEGVCLPSLEANKSRGRSSAGGLLGRRMDAA